jgi:hypothetical protein
MREGVIQISKFLNKKLTEKQLTDICQHLNLDNLTRNEFINYEKLAKGIGLSEIPEIPETDQRSLLRISKDAINLKFETCYNLIHIIYIYRL